MKKLALALVCLVGVAFFASCNKTVENPEPTISIYEEEGFVKDGDVVDLNTEIQFGFVMASNAETEKELKSLTIKIGEAQETIDLPGLTEYTYKDAITFTLEARDIVAEGVIEATVIDEDGETATATITLSLNEAAQPLTSTPIEWVKTGHNAQDLSAYGLFWKELNFKSPFTHIVPADNCTMYLVEDGAAAYESIKTDVDLASYYNNLVETSRPCDDYDKIDCNQSGTYKNMLITKDAAGNFHAIFIDRAEITTPSGLGTRITITGEAK